MYQYVESNEVKRYRSYCSKVLEDVRDDLYDSFGINTNFSLVEMLEIWSQGMEMLRLTWTTIYILYRCQTNFGVIYEN